MRVVIGMRCGSGGKGGGVLSYIFPFWKCAYSRGLEVAINRRLTVMKSLNQLVSPWPKHVRFPLKDTHREKAHSNKTSSLSKVWIWIFGWLLRQINSLYEVLKMKQNFRKIKIVTGKTSFFVIGPFCIHHSTCLNIGFW